MMVGDHVARHVAGIHQEYMHITLMIESGDRSILPLSRLVLSITSLPGMKLSIA